MHPICKICLMSVVCANALGLVAPRLVAWSAEPATTPATRPLNRTAPPSVPPGGARDDSAQLDDPVEPLIPLHKRSGRDEDRVRALALFAAGRVAEQEQDYPRALRNYERAYRFDPDALPALREVVPLAFNLDRQAEAVRYALIMAEREPSDPVLLRRLAIYLTEEGDTTRALKLYERALPLEEKEKRSANLVLLRMELGRLYFVAKRYDQAAHQFGEVVQAINSPGDYGLDPAMLKTLLNKAELTYQLFAESFLEAGRVADAQSAFDKANQAKPDEALYLYNLARLAAKQKQPEQALARLQTYLDKHFATQGTSPYQLFGEMLAELGQSDQRVDRLEKAHAADPENVPLAYFLAQNYRQAGQFDKAEPIYRAVLERNKARPPLEVYQGLLDIYRKRQDADQLLSTLGDAVGRSGSLSSLGESGKALLAETETARSILKAAERQMSVDEKQLSYGARLAAGLVAIELTDFAAADKFFNAALKAEHAKPNEALVTWGLELFLANQYAEAAKVFQRGLDQKALPEDNPALYFYLAGALEMSGETDKALEAARHAAELQKDSPRFQSRVAWIQYHAKRHEAARQSYRELIEKFDKTYDSTEVREVLRDARLVLSNIAVLEDHAIDAEEWLEQVLDEFPEDIGALNDLGYLWADAGKHLERARQMVQIAVDQEPNNMAYRDSLGWVLYRLGLYPQAVAELKAAAGVEEPDGVILDHLADAQFKAGDVAGALESWNRAVELFNKRGDAEKIPKTQEKIRQAQQPPAKN